MRKYLYIVSLASLLATAGCVRIPALSEPAPLPLPSEAGPICAVIQSAGEAPQIANAEELMLLLDRAVEDRSCTAGSSLRVAALAGGLLHWLSETEAGPEEARRIALAWAEKRGGTERHRAGRTMHLLREAAERMEERELEALLLDAGFDLPVQGPERERFLALTEELGRTLAPEIFKNPGEIMNISGRNHCGDRKSVL